MRLVQNHILLLINIITFIFVDPIKSRGVKSLLVLKWLLPPFSFLDDSASRYDGFGVQVQQITAAVGVYGMYPCIKSARMLYKQVAVK